MNREVHKVKESSKEIKDKIAEACKQVVLQDEVVKMRDGLQKQLAQARQQFANAKQQVAVWEAKINQIAGGVATCNQIMQKSQKTKRLELESDNSKEPKKK